MIFIGNRLKMTTLVSAKLPTQISSAYPEVFIAIFGQTLLKSDSCSV